MKKRQDDEIMLQEFLDHHGFQTPTEPKGRKTFGKVFIAFTMFLVCSIALGGLLFAPIAMAVSGATIGAAPFIQYWKEVPNTLPEISIAQRNTIYDKNGAVIAQSWSENRIPLKSIDQISPYAIQGLVDTEDKRFYQTNGFDPKGTARALLKGKGGGSGITQQLIKNLQYYNLLGKEKKQSAVERSIPRKIRELKMARKYDETHSKDEILLAYFNTVALGSPNIYGIETASKYFFNKKAKDLSLAEASALVGTAQNPIIFNMNDPQKFKKWKARQADVLGRMQAEGHITAAQADAAKKQPLKLVKKSTGGGCTSSSYPFYCKYVMDYLKNDPSLGANTEEREAILAKGGLQIHTYMDPIVMNSIEKYMNNNWGDKNRIIAPTAVVQPGTGGVLGFGVNRKLGNGKGKTEIVLPTMPASEGSAYKLFTLAAALNNGYNESNLTFGSECPLRPGPNYDSPPGGFRNSNSCKLQGGVLNYKQATAYSSNTWYVTLEKRIGVEKVKEFSKSVNLSAPDEITDRSLSYALGAVGNSPIRVAAAYATFANKGVFCPATPVSKVNYLDGTEPAVPDNYDSAIKSCRSVMSPASSSIVLKALRANVSGEVKKAFGIRANVKGYDNGGKSGTNEGFNSAWAHLTGYYSLYTNVYDMEKTVRGVDGAIFKGKYTTWKDNTAETTGSDLMKELMRGKRNIPLDWNNQNTEYTKTKVDVSDFFTVPSTIGMEPEEALSVYKSLNVKAYVNKKTKTAPEGFPKGVILEQSIAPGEKLVHGTKKEIVLTISN